MKRNRKVQINESIFDEFFSSVGKYPGINETLSNISNIWKSVLMDQYPTNIFSLLEKGNIREIKGAYENYYVNGISDGACGGKGLDKFSRRWEITQRSIKRLEPLKEHFGVKSDYKDQHLAPPALLSKLTNNFNVPKVIEIGQPWGWFYNNTFYHYELADHIYFADIIIKVLDLLKLNKICFLGDGTGLTGCLVNNNYNVETAHFIDLAHFLLKQYILNRDRNAKFHYAENFITDNIMGSQILINQDSFPEIPSECLDNYFQCLNENKIEYVLSYNHEIFADNHVDYRKKLIDIGMSSAIRFESSLRSKYIIELFYKL